MYTLQEIYDIIGSFPMYIIYRGVPYCITSFSNDNKNPKWSYIGAPLLAGQPKYFNGGGKEFEIDKKAYFDKDLNELLE